VQRTTLLINNVLDTKNSCPQLFAWENSGILLHFTSSASLFAMAGNQPLFTPERRSSATSEERASREDDALLGNQRGESESKPWNRAGFWREVGLFTWAVLATATIIVLAVVLQHQSRSSSSQDGKFKKPAGKRNLIFMVSDGSEFTHSFLLNQNPHANLDLQWAQPVFPSPGAFDSTKAVCQ
jgi:hypothetical protein